MANRILFLITGVLATCLTVASVSGADWTVNGKAEYPATLRARPLQFVRMPTPATSQPVALSSRPASQPASAATRPGESKVIVYYFHRTLRCPTCHLIEQLTRQVLDDVFPGELAGGMLEWRVVDFEAGGNQHFEKDYKLQTQSIVLVREAGGKETEWKNLDKLWDVIGEPAEFMKYMQDSTRAFLDAPAAGESK